MWAIIIYDSISRSHSQGLSWQPGNNMFWWCRKKCAAAVLICLTWRLLLWFSPSDAAEVTPPAVDVVETQINSMSLEPPPTGLVDGEDYEEYEDEDDEDDDDDEWDWKGSDMTKRYNSMNRPGLNSQVRDERPEFACEPYCVILICR